MARTLQDLRADLHLTVDELAGLYSVPAAVIWRILEPATVDLSDRVPGMVS